VCVARRAFQVDDSGIRGGVRIERGKIADL